MIGPSSPRLSHRVSLLPCLSLLSGPKRRERDARGPTRETGDGTDGGSGPVSSSSSCVRSTPDMDLGLHGLVIPPLAPCLTEGEGTSGPRSNLPGSELPWHSLGPSARMTRPDCSHPALTEGDDNGESRIY